MTMKDSKKRNGSWILLISRTIYSIIFRNLNMALGLLLQVGVCPKKNV